MPVTSHYLGCTHLFVKFRSPDLSPSPLITLMSGFSGGSVVKNSPVSAGARGGSVRSLGREDSLEEEMAFHSGILLGKSHGRRSLVGFSRGVATRTQHTRTTLTRARIEVTVFKVTVELFVNFSCPWITFTLDTRSIRIRKKNYSEM